jgi:hypothetical protein
MTYRELLRYLQLLETDEPDQLDKDVTVYDVQKGELYRVDDFDNTEGVDVLDDDHPILVFNEDNPGE